MYPNLKLQPWRSGIRQNRLAQMLNVDETRLSKIINGFREPGEDLRERIAVLLESDPVGPFERVERKRGPEAADPTTGVHLAGEKGA